jgi:hypothetical protein
MDAEISRWTGSDRVAPEFYMIQGEAEEALMRSYREHIGHIERVIARAELVFLGTLLLFWVT